MPTSTPEIGQKPPKIPLPQLRKDSNKHRQIALLSAFFDAVKQYNKKYPDAKLSTIMTSGLAEAFETTFKTFDALVNNEKETTTNINHQFEELRSSIENIQRDITVIKADTVVVAATSTSFSSVGPRARANRIAGMPCHWRQLKPSPTAR